MFHFVVNKQRLLVRQVEVADHAGDPLVPNFFLVIGIGMLGIIFWFVKYRWAELTLDPPGVNVIKLFSFIADNKA